MAVLKIKIDGRWTELPALTTQSGTAVFAPDYDDLTFPVNEGQSCVHDGLFFIAREDIDDEESWTPEHWRLTTFGEEIEAHGASIEQITDIISVLNIASTAETAEIISGFITETEENNAAQED